MLFPDTFWRLLIISRFEEYFIILNHLNILIEINKEKIASLAAEREEENDAFRLFLRNRDTAAIDELVSGLNEKVTPAVDCTTCGACCKNLMINVVSAEITPVAKHLHLTDSAFREKYIEESEGGQMIMNTIPCHFLSGTKCTVYENRFAECRDFPHLHKPNFTGRLFGTLMHYSICPIIYNVVEQLKIQTGFKQDESNK